MFKKLTAMLLLLLLPAGALAEVYEGVTAALSTLTLRAEASGTVTALEARPGERLEAGDIVASLKGERVFATQDGTVSLIYADEGEPASGTELALLPVEQYLIHCTVDDAWQSAESTLVHSGETVYVKCTADGTHHAIGIITQIDGAEYRVLTLGGELYIGETVYLYRDEAFTAARRVGIGTVVSANTETYAADGEITRLRVAEGDDVERGQLLYEVGGGSVAVPVSGILTSISVQSGDAVRQDQVIAALVPKDQICVEIQADETAAAQIAAGDSAQLIFAGGDDESAISGTVIDVAWIAESDTYRVRIRPETAEGLALGMRVSVRL